MEERLIRAIAHHFATSPEGEVVEFTFVCGGRKVPLFAKVGDAAKGIPAAVAFATKVGILSGEAV